MIARVFFFLFAFLGAAESQAQFARVEGSYSSHDVTVQVFLLDDENGIAAAKTVVTSGACSGSVAGIGRIEGLVLTITPYVKIPGGDACKLTLSFDAAWKKVKISGESCSAYSGASCGWEGQAAVKSPAK